MRPLRALSIVALSAAALTRAEPALAQGYGGTVADIVVRGESLIAQKRYPEAVVQFQEARQLCPTSAETVRSLQGEAQGRLELGEILPAAGLLEEAAAKYPDDPRVADMLYQAGVLRARGGEPDPALDRMRKALDSKPTPDLAPQIKLEMAQILRTKGKKEPLLEAVGLLKDFETAYPDSPHVPNALYTLAIVHHDLGDYQQSEKIYREILTRYSGARKVPLAYVETYFELGTVLAAEGRPREAADYYRKYVILNPSSPFAAAALERAGDQLLFRSPRMSAELYGLAQVKAAANPKPALSELELGRWIGPKKRLAETLSRVWVVAAAGLVAAAALAFLGRRLLLRRRRQPGLASA